MTENKDRSNAPFNPLFDEEENFDYPSDRLTLRDLRLHWPEAAEMGEVIGRVRYLEHSLAEGIAVDIDYAARNEPRSDAKKSAELRESRKEARQFVKDFYVQTGLAAGDHAAELLLRGIEERARKQYQPKYPPGPR